MYQPGLRVMADTGVGVAEWLRHLGRPNPLPVIQPRIAPAGNRGGDGGGGDGDGDGGGDDGDGLARKDDGEDDSGDGGFPRPGTIEHVVAQGNPEFRGGRRKTFKKLRKRKNKTNKKKKRRKRKN